MSVSADSAGGALAYHEIIVDLFAGGGGASTGIEQALGRYVEIAINHDPEAVALHQANHPMTTHHVCDVFEVDPVTACGGFDVGLLWASPDCKHFSKAKGGKPVSKKIRSLAWVVVRWARAVRPRVICLENVEEFQTWGPLGDDNRPCPQRKGRTFRRWKRSLEALGYTVEHRELRACDYGAPTIRRRLFLVARRDGVPIVWPEPTHGAPDSLPVRAGKLKPWPVAAECIDWSQPCPSIFERSRPLADATLRRIAKGVMRYVVNAAEPFVVPGPAAPFLTEHANGSTQRVFGASEPLRTQVAQIKGGHFALVSAFLAQFNNHSGADPHAGRAATAPFSTVTASGSQQALVHAFLIKYYGADQDPRLPEPLHTVTTLDRFGLVTVHGEPYAIVDIGLRMLTPRELYRAQGFPESYVIDRGADGRPLTKKAQVRMCGNSVCPPLARAIVAANYTERGALRAVA